MDGKATVKGAKQMFAAILVTIVCALSLILSVSVNRDQKVAAATIWKYPNYQLYDINKFSGNTTWYDMHFYNVSYQMTFVKTVSMWYGTAWNYDRYQLLWEYKR